MFRSIPPHPESMQHLSTDHELYKGGTLKLQQPVKRNHILDPLDEAIWVDEGSVMVKRSEKVKGQDTYGRQYDRRR